MPLKPYYLKQVKSVIQIYFLKFDPHFFEFCIMVYRSTQIIGKQRKTNNLRRSHFTFQLWLLANCRPKLFKGITALVTPVPSSLLPPADGCESVQCTLYTALCFRSIVALHSFRLKLCSVKYIVHCTAPLLQCTKQYAIL